MNPQAATLHDDDHLIEQLSAYLDGELADADCQQVEQLLVRSHEARACLRQLERASTALDALPRTQVDPSFTQSTVEMVALRVADEAGPPDAEARPLAGRSALLAAVVLASAMAIGYRAMDQLAPNANRALVEDLPVLRDLDALRQVDDVDLLRQLRGAGVFEADPSPPTARPVERPELRPVPREESRP